MATRMVVRLMVLAFLLVIADVAYTPSNHRQEVRALATRAPDTTAYMRTAGALGHPVRLRAWVPLTAIAPVAACAVILAEDEDFFDKGTVSWRTQRRLFQRLARGDFSQGGSGVSQQLARNLFLSPDRTPRRKAREYLLAHELSRTLPKERLLELYLNLAEWGDGVWGIEAASRHYFGVSASALTTSQAVVLATFLPAPRRGLPYVLGGYPRIRQEGLVRKLWRSRLLSDAELRETVDRVREWRDRVRTSRNARDGWAHVATLMGPEPPSFTASTWTRGAPPLARLCDPRRRGV